MSKSSALWALAQAKKWGISKGISDHVTGLEAVKRKEGRRRYGILTLIEEPKKKKENQKGKLNSELYL